MRDLKKWNPICIQKTGNKEKYSEFYGEYGRLIKEGVYQDFEHKDALTELLRFKSTKDDGLVSLREYVDRMREGQKSIYYITGQNQVSLKNSPLLEMYHKKDLYHYQLFML